MRKFLGILVVFTITINAANAIDYFGVKLGSLRNASFGLTGDIWLVNATAVQITNFNLSPAREKLDLSFYFSTANEVAKVVQIYQILDSPNGQYAKPIGVSLDGGFQNARLVLIIPNNYKKWTFFGVVAEEQWFYLGAVNVNDKTAPEPFCCIKDAGNPNRGLVGTWYNSGAAPIRVLDAKTLVLPSFTFEGTKPPDGWIYAGRGKVDQSTGKKALVVGRDSPALHCPLREDYNGNQDLVVQLADGQTVYDINYLSVYCFAVGVDFGHVPVNLTPQRNPVPPSIPPVRDGPPPAALQAWTRPQVVILPEGDKPIDLTFSLGPPAGARARAMRSICDSLQSVWYVQGQMTPEIWVQRGKTYRLKAQGGQQHPLYITSEETGGYIEKPVSEQAAIKNFVGGDGKNVGSKCEFAPIDDRRASDFDAFETFDEFRHFLQNTCEKPIQSGQLKWIPDASTPNVVYYGSFTTFNMGGPIRVCNQIGGSLQDPKCINN